MIIKDPRKTAYVMHERIAQILARIRDIQKLLRGGEESDRLAPESIKVYMFFKKNYRSIEEVIVSKKMSELEMHFY